MTKDKMCFLDGKWFCSNCGSTEIKQVSVETVHSYPNTGDKYIKWDSEYQEYYCEKCGVELTGHINEEATSTLILRVILAFFFLPLILCMHRSAPNSIIKKGRDSD
jgi:hypothetical protein